MQRLLLHAGRGSLAAKSAPRRVWEKIDSGRIVGRAFLFAAAFQAALSRLKAGCGQDWPPHIAASRKLN